MTKNQLFYINYKQKCFIRFNKALIKFRDSNKTANDYYWFMHDIHMSMRPGGISWSDVHDLLEKHLDGEIIIEP